MAVAGLGEMPSAGYRTPCPAGGLAETLPSDSQAGGSGYPGTRWDPLALASPLAPFPQNTQLFVHVRDERSPVDALRQGARHGDPKWNGKVLYM
jgi:hypothetical protein